MIFQHNCIKCGEDFQVSINDGNVVGGKVIGKSRLDDSEIWICSFCAENDGF